MPFARLASQKDEWMADKLRIPKLKQSNHSESSDGSPDAMYRMTPSDRGRRISGMFADLFRTANSSLSPADPDGLRYLAVVSVIGHWFIAAVVLFEIVYRPYYGLSRYAAYILLLLILVGFTGDLHHRLRSGRTITSLRLQALYAMDLALVSASLAISYGFRHPFIHLFYYPALATFALVSTSLGRTMAVVTTVSIIYIATSLTVGDGLDFVARDEKALVARIVLFYVVVLTVDVASRFERIRWQNAVARERQLQQERIELSQTLHDTTAQTAYMIGLGIHRARQLAGKSNEDLVAALDATSALLRSAMWEMRGPIDAGHIVEGRELGRVLWSHCATFEKITGLHAELSQSGAEPPLAKEIRTRLFSIAHNALTNSFLHARPSRVTVRLIFYADRIMLSVSDDGVGLPDDYAGRGRGFDGMRTDAERVGGELIVESGEGGDGTTITCVVPHEVNQRGG